MQVGTGRSVGSFAIDCNTGKTPSSTGCYGFLEEPQTRQLQSIGRPSLAACGVQALCRTTSVTGNTRGACGTPAISWVSAFTNSAPASATGWWMVDSGGSA